MRLNEKYAIGNYPILVAITYNNIEIVILLIVYALRHQIILEYKYDQCLIELIENKPEIKNLLQNYEIEIEKWKRVIK